MRRRLILTCLLVLACGYWLVDATIASASRPTRAGTRATEIALLPEHSLRLAGGRSEFESAPIASEFRFMALGATWTTALPDSVGVTLEVSTSEDGRRWGPWLALEVVEDDAPEHRGPGFTALLFVEGRHARLRARFDNPDRGPVVLEGLALTLIDATDGPTAPAGRLSTPGNGPPPVISRAAWGANEGYRYDGNGNELWPREYRPARALFVHHTATSPSADPAASMRAIYYYHAVTLGWGDIGYHYVIDQYGNIYQGRYGTESNGQLVVGGHVLGYNLGTMGISLIGNFQSASPSAAAVASLREHLAWRAAHFGIDPLAPVWLEAQGSHPSRTFDHALMGHRDSHQPARTTCPGDNLYVQLPSIRSWVAQRIVDIQQPVTVQLAEPAPGATLSGSVRLQSNASPNTVRVDYTLEGSLIGSATAPPWTLDLDAASLPAGNWLLEAHGVSAVGSRGSDEADVTVAVSTPPAPLAAAPPAVPGIMRSVRLPLLSYQPSRVCTTHVANATFDTNTGWIMLLGDYAARYSTEQALSGARSLRAGMAPGDNVGGFSSARIPITLPASALDVTLQVYYMPRINGSGAPDADRQYLGILDADEQYIESIVPSGLSHSDTWLHAEYDLSHHLGETIYLYVGVKNDGGGAAAALFVDDIQVTSCQWATLTTKP